ncbi:MAG TPA: LPS export ABC transporter periplasmic protein LptC [Phnomibacter sp.]|nr:LPS export ABC transporter periplasmic protein LptC [Phnomibacter sp.]
MVQRGVFNSILLTALATMVLWGCENDPAEIEAMTRDSKEVEEAKGIKATFSQSGILKAILEAPLMYRVRGDTIYTEFPETLLVTFYNELGQQESVVSAHYARYLEMYRKVYLRDSVVVYNVKGDTLYADDLWWDQDQEIFYTERPVRIRSITQQLDGTGITAKSDFSKYTIHNPKGPVAIPEEIDPEGGQQPPQ